MNDSEREEWRRDALSLQADQGQPQAYYLATVCLPRTPASAHATSPAEDRNAVEIIVRPGTPYTLTALDALGVDHAAPGARYKNEREARLGALAVIERLILNPAKKVP